MKLTGAPLRLSVISARAAARTLSILELLQVLSGKPGNEHSIGEESHFPLHPRGRCLSYHSQWLVRDTCNHRKVWVIILFFFCTDTRVTYELLRCPPPPDFYVPVIFQGWTLRPGLQLPVPNSCVRDLNEVERIGYRLGWQLVYENAHKGRLPRT